MLNGRVILRRCAKHEGSGGYIFWIDSLNGKRSKYSNALSKLIEEDIPVVTCPVIIQEILQGFNNDKDFKSVQENLSGFEMLELDPLKASLGAASLYRELRKKGITLRKSNDCLIAFFCLHFKIPILHKDKDFDKIGRFTALKIFTP